MISGLKFNEKRQQSRVSALGGLLFHLPARPRTPKNDAPNRLLLMGKYKKHGVLKTFKKEGEKTKNEKKGKRREKHKRGKRTKENKKKEKRKEEKRKKEKKKQLYTKLPIIRACRGRYVK